MVCVCVCFIHTVWLFDCDSAERCEVLKRRAEKEVAGCPKSQLGGSLDSLPAKCSQSYKGKPATKGLIKSVRQCLRKQGNPDKSLKSNLDVSKSNHEITIHCGFQ